jgi:hypothetical protein
LDKLSRIGKYEEHFTHTGSATLVRPRLGLAQDKNRSPFRRRFAEHEPIDMQTNYLGTDDVLLEPDGVGDKGLPPVMPLPQLHLIYADGKKKRVRIDPESFTSEEVLQIIGETIPKKWQCSV